MEATGQRRRHARNGLVGLMGGVVTGVALIVVGIVIFALRGFSGRFGARTQNAAFDTDKVQPAWIEAWNFVLGVGLVVAGVVTIVVSA